MGRFPTDSFPHFSADIRSFFLPRRYTNIACSCYFSCLISSMPTEERKQESAWSSGEASSASSPRKTLRTRAHTHTHTVALHARLWITHFTPDHVSPIPRIHSLLRIRRTAHRKVVCTHVDTYTCVEEGCHYEEEGHVLHSGGTHT